MPSERPSLGSPEDWLTRAAGDLALASAPLPAGALLEDLCFHAQQAAEKAIKAVYRHRGIAFRYTHDIAELLNGLAAHVGGLPSDVMEAAELSPYAWQSRYPGTAEPVTEAEYQRSLLHARAALEWARSVTGIQPE